VFESSVANVQQSNTLRIRPNQTSLLCVRHLLECGRFKERDRLDILVFSLLAQHRASQGKATIAGFFDLYAVGIVSRALP
jgi:hypothetical protein